MELKYQIEKKPKDIESYLPVAKNGRWTDICNAIKNLGATDCLTLPINPTDKKLRVNILNACRNRKMKVKAAQKNGVLYCFQSR